MLKLTLFAAALAGAGTCAIAQQIAQPAPVAAQAADSAKVALANHIAAALWPDGTYGRMAKTLIGGEGSLSDLVLDMRPDDIMGAFMQGMAAAKDGKGAKPAPVAPKAVAKPSPTLREQMTKEDPYFDERMRITVKVASEEIARIARPVEPKMRDGIAKSVARRFDKPQLEQIAAFFATDAGKAYAAQSVSLFIDKDVVLAMVQAAPAIFKELPAVVKKVEKATAHLPAPPKPKAADSEDDGNEDSGLPET